MLVFHFYYKIILNIHYVSFLLGHSILQIALPLPLSLKYDLLQIALQFNAVCNVLVVHVHIA